MVHSPSSTYVVWVGGRQHPLKCIVQDSGFQHVIQVSLLPTLKSLQGLRLFTTYFNDTLVLFFFSRDVQKLITQKLHISSGMVVAGGEQFFGNKHLFAGSRIWKNKLHLYYIPKDQNRLLVYSTSDGLHFDFKEYTIPIPAFTQRVHHDQIGRPVAVDYYFITQVRSAALDPIAALSLSVKWYAFEEVLCITLDEPEVVHKLTIQEDSHEIEYEQIPIRIKGYKPNTALYFHSLLMPNGQLYRLSRFERQYYLHIANDTTLTGPIPLFGTNPHADSLAPIYTETLERNRERKTEEQMHRVKKIKRMLNDGTCLIRIDHTQKGDTLLADVGAVRFVEPVFAVSPRYNALDYFDYGYDPWQGQRSYGRSSQYYVYDYVKTSLFNQRWFIHTATSNDIRERFLNALDWVKKETIPEYYDWLEWNGTVYLMYLDKQGLVYRILLK